MNCPSRETLLIWLDGELPEPAKIIDHVEICPECLRFTDSQKRMEALWREDWTDPEDSAFELFRTRLAAPLPWWRRQRSWFIAAAVFAVYLGVRVFHFEGAAPDLSRMAEQEARRLEQPPPSFTESTLEETQDAYGETPESEMAAELPIESSDSGDDTTVSSVSEQSPEENDPPTPEDAQTGLPSGRSIASSPLLEGMVADESVYAGSGGLSVAVAASGAYFSSGMDNAGEAEYEAEAPEEIRMLYSAEVQQDAAVPQVASMEASPEVSFTVTLFLEDETAISPSEWPELFELVQGAVMEAQDPQKGDEWLLTVYENGSVWKQGEYLGTVPLYDEFTEGSITATLVFL